MKTLETILVLLMLVAAGCGDEKDKTGTPPPAPTELSQNSRNGAEVLPWGGQTGDDEVLLSARVASNPGDLRVRLLVELALEGTFRGIPTMTSGWMANGERVIIRAPIPQAGAYCWRAWAEDSVGRSSGVASTPAGTAFTMDPLLPTDPAQNRIGGYWSIGSGTETTDIGVELSARVRSLDGTMVRPQFEVKPLGTPFDGGNLQLGLYVSSSSTSKAVVLLPVGSYHWRVRAENIAGPTGPWLYYGGNDALQPEPADFIRVSTSELSTPALPSSLGQFHSDAVTAIPFGGDTAEDKVVLSAYVSAPAGMSALEVEVKAPLQGFDGTNTVLGSFVGGGASRAAVSLSPGSWHWRARTKDVQGSVSDWVIFSGAPTSTDFKVLSPVNQPPLAPTSLRQYQSNGWQGMSVGDVVAQSSTIVKADVSDPDPGNGLVLEVEVKPFGTPFTNVPSAASLILSSGSSATVMVTGLTPQSAYHWQARAVDQAGAASAWVEYLGSTPSEEAPPSYGGGSSGGGCGGTIAVPPGIGILPLALLAAAFGFRPRRGSFRASR